MSKNILIGITGGVLVTYMVIAIFTGWIASGQASYACSHVSYDNYAKITDNFHPERHYEPNMWALGTTGVCKS